MKFILGIGDKFLSERNTISQVVAFDESSKKVDIQEYRLEPVNVLNEEEISFFKHQVGENNAYRYTTTLDNLRNVLSSFYGKEIEVVIDTEGVVKRSEKIRQLTGCSRAEFHRRYDIPIRTLEAWDSGVSNPPIYVLNFLEEVVKRDVFSEIFEGIRGTGKQKELLIGLN